jgi:hypothetical protein
MASPIKKKDGFLWLVQDYQMLNNMTVKNKLLGRQNRARTALNHVDIL